MTAEENNAELAQVVAERFGEDVVPLNPGTDYTEPMIHNLVPTDEQVMPAARRAMINGIRALADYFVKHPEIPTPDHVMATFYVTDGDALRGIAEQLGERLYGGDGDDAGQFEATIFRLNEDGAFGSRSVQLRGSHVTPKDRERPL